MDVEIKTQNQRFNYCARAIIRQDDKVLVMCVNDADYYHLPGGHVEIGETSAAAIVREAREETGIEIVLGDLVAVQEQFYDKKGTANHSVLFYYLAQPKTPVKTENSVRIENDHGYVMKNELRWVSLDELKNLDFRPQSIKHLILQNQLEQLQHLVDEK